MRRIIQAFIDALLLRCPRCRRGRMFAGWFRMHRRCPACGLPYERAEGEITGGMGFNIVVTLLLVIVAAAVIGFSGAPLAPALLGLGAATILFPILFYPFSRALWAAVLFLTGDNAEW
jgi:uncharacterized protein (DUF983 family)